LHASDVPQPVVDDVVLLASELVTNALLHARSAPNLDVAVRGRSVRCSVTDDSPQPPRRRHYANDAATGRGIALVEMIAARWGTERVRDGKCVWFEIDYDPNRGVTTRSRTTPTRR
jgi:anti-sigma regulatory factor (Ser/Thr protein kinase)